MVLHMSGKEFQSCFSWSSLIQLICQLRLPMSWVVTFKTVPVDLFIDMEKSFFAVGRTNTFAKMVNVLNVLQAPSSGRILKVHQF